MEISLHKTISIHALCEEGDLLIGGAIRSQNISIHALCEEGDGLDKQIPRCSVLFLSTPSARRATHRRLPVWLVLCHFYPRPLRGGRPLSRLPCRTLHVISIHALCEEGDGPKPFHRGWQQYFYPRPLRGGRLPCTTNRHSLCVISIHALCEEGDSPNPASLQIC